MMFLGVLACCRGEHVEEILHLKMELGAWQTQSS